MKNRIKVLRLENDLSQRALAEKIGCSQKSIDGWEKGLSEPTAGFICALADCFACSADYLLGREDDFGNINVSYGIPERQSELLRDYAALSENDQIVLREFVEFLLAKQSQKT